MTENHALLPLGKLTEDQQTVSGKCKAGDARYNGRSQGDIERQHEEHLQQLGLSVGQPLDEAMADIEAEEAREAGAGERSTPLAKVVHEGHEHVESVEPTPALHEGLDPEREQRWPGSSVSPEDPYGTGDGSYPDPSRPS